MPGSSDRKVVLVTRRTRLEDLITRYQTLAQAKFYVEHLGADFSDYQKEHDTFLTERRRTVEILENWGRYQVMSREFLPNFIFAPSDIVVALGQDGLVANTMKYLDGQRWHRGRPARFQLRNASPDHARRPAGSACGLTAA